jgi:hypothetical protein
MKFRIEKGVSVYCRKARGAWSIGRWSNMVTEKTVEFDVSDMWFAPKQSSLQEIHRKALNEPDDFRKRINNGYYMHNYYGFHLPKNKYNVEQIVVPEPLVTIISDPKETSHVSEQKKLERKVHKSRSEYIFPGKLFAR